MYIYIYIYWKAQNYFATVSNDDDKDDGDDDGEIIKRCVVTGYSCVDDKQDTVLTKIYPLTFTTKLKLCFLLIQWLLSLDINLHLKLFH